MVSDSNKKLLKTIFVYVAWFILGAIVWRYTASYNSLVLEDVFFTLYFKLDKEQIVLTNILFFVKCHAETMLAFFIGSILLGILTTSSIRKFLFYYLAYSLPLISTLIMVYLGKTEVHGSSQFERVIISSIDIFLPLSFCLGFSGCLLGNMIRKKIFIHSKRVAH